ncbi:MAG TPA: alpha/beta hydrolase-fold protein [Ktedonobacterales bacterium]
MPSDLTHADSLAATDEGPTAEPTPAHATSAAPHPAPDTLPHTLPDDLAEVARSSSLSSSGRGSGDGPPSVRTARSVWSAGSARASAWASAWVSTQWRRLSDYLWQRRLPLTLALLGNLATICVALATGMLLVANGIDTATSNELVATGFDAERARLITAFCLALLVSGAAGFVALRRGAAWLGGFGWFVVNYLAPLVQQSQQPASGPDAQAVALAGALAHVVLTLAALSLLFAGIGAVLGEASGHMVIAPLLTLGLSLGRRLAISLHLTKRRAGPGAFSVIARPLAAATLVTLALAIGVPDLGSLLSYGVSTELYQPAQTAPHNGQGSVEQGSFVSAALGGQTRGFSVYLPPSYSWADAQTLRYPTIYLLHGAPGGYTDWFSAGHVAEVADAAYATHVARGVIIVSPDGNGTKYRSSAWVNSYDNKQRMEDAIATDLVDYIDSHYRTLADPSDRAIGGLSEGGYGAANIALHRPDIFSKVMSLDGFYETTNSPVFGPYGTGYRNYNSPSIYLQNSEGQKAVRRITFIVAVGTKDVFYKDGSAFVKKLQALGVPMQLIQTDGGHNWAQWGQQFAQSLPLLVAAPKSPTSGATR